MYFNVKTTSNSFRRKIEIVVDGVGVGGPGQPWAARAALGSLGSRPTIVAEKTLNVSLVQSLPLFQGPGKLSQQCFGVVMQMRPRPAVRPALKVAQTVAQKLLGTNGNWTFNRLAISAQKFQC